MFLLLLLLYLSYEGFDGLKAGLPAILLEALNFRFKLEWSI